MNKNKNFVNELLKDLKDTSKYLSEAYIFDGQEGDQIGYDMEGMEGPMHDAGPRVMQQQSQDVQHGDNAEAQAMHAQEVIKHEPIIGKIRETAIEGLKKYADNPTSDIYNYFKKVFLDSDKVLTNDGKSK